MVAVPGAVMNMEVKRLKMTEIKLYLPFLLLVTNVCASFNNFIFRVPITQVLLIKKQEW